MFERGDGLRFAQKPFAERDSGLQRRPEDLDGDGAIQASVAGAVDFAIPPAPTSASSS
jgi:hypothetical protein